MGEGKKQMVANVKAPEKVACSPINTANPEEQRNHKKPGNLPRLITSALLALLISSPAYAYKEDKNWPCIQAKVEKLSAGQMWPNLTTKADDQSWRDDKTITALVEQLLPRRTTLVETDKIIKEFAEKHEGPTLNIALEKTFLGLLTEINTIRAEIINGIGRFSNRQKDLVKRITDTRHKITDYEKKDTDGTLTKEEDRELVKLEQALEWDQRIHEEREQSLEFVCEAPVLLEQRLFSLARQLQSYTKS